MSLSAVESVGLAKLSPCARITSSTLPLLFDVVVEINGAVTDSIGRCVVAASGSVGLGVLQRLMGVETLGVASAFAGVADDDDATDATDRSLLCGFGSENGDGRLPPADPSVAGDRIISVGIAVGVGVDTRRLLPHHRLERRDGEFVRHRERVVAERAAAVAPRTTVWWQRIESHDAQHGQLRSVKVDKQLWQTAKRVGIDRLELRVNSGLPC